MFKKYKKQFIIAAAVLAVLTAALVLLLVGKNAGWFGGGKTPDSPGTDDPDKKTYNVFTLDPGELKCLTVHNTYGTMEVVSETPYIFEINDMEYEIDEDALLTLVVYTTEIDCDMLVAENPDNLAQYGLENTKVYFTVEDRDGNKTTVYLGNTTPSKDGVYLRVEGNGNVYVASEYLDDLNLLRPAAFLSYDLVPALETDSTSEGFDITRLTKIRINSESTGREDIVIEYVPESEFTGPSVSYYRYVMTNPSTGITLNSEYFETYVYAALTGITAMSAVTISPTEAELEEYKLSDPWGVLELVIDGKTYTMTVGRVVYDTYCYVMMGEAVYFVPSSYFVCLDATVASLQSRFMFLESIQNFSTITVSYMGKTYRFAQSGTMFDENDPWKVTTNGVETDGDEFKKLYTLMLSMFIGGTTAEGDTVGDEVLKITYKYVSSSEEVTLTYYQLDLRRYAIKFNGDDTTYYTMRKYLDKFVAGLSNYISGNTIDLYA